MPHLKGWRPKRRTEHEGPRNEDRAEQGDRIIGFYNTILNNIDEEDGINYTDCLTDLFHSMASCGINPQDIVDTALMHFEAER